MASSRILSKDVKSGLSKTCITKYEDDYKIHSTITDDAIKLNK